MALNENPERVAGRHLEKVGVVLVHGIGEQRRFEHLESETRKIVDAIIENYGKRRRNVTVTLQTGAGDAFQGDQSSWISGSEAPLHALVELDAKVVDIAFHEVWWADVNETLTLGKQVRFWCWGLSLSGIVTDNERILPGALTQVRLPDHHGELTWWHRFRMGFVGVLFALSAFSIAWVNLILKRLNFAPLLSTGTIVNYLSAVKVYVQTKRAGGSPMDGPDEPPRAAIRRRMIRTIIDVATHGYDRWYILAHSLGSVVAWNGIMETEQALPNYLDRTRWQCVQSIPGLAGNSPTGFNINAMMPNRPVWLDGREIINRDILFRSFRGMLTYGSPLERFGALWASKVPINRQEDVFLTDAEWINVYDPTDPVGTWIVNFDGHPSDPPQPGRTALTPRNFPCRSSPVLLLSHICYLTSSRLRALRFVGDTQHLLVNHVAHWLVSGGSLATRLSASPKGLFTFWMPLARPVTPGRAGEGLAAKLRTAWRFIQWAAVAIVLTLLALASLQQIVFPSLSWLIMRLNIHG